MGRALLWRLTSTLVFVAAVAGCTSPSSITTVVVTVVNTTAQEASAIWTEGASSRSGTTPYRLPPCSIERFGFGRGSTTTVVLTTTSGVHRVIVVAPMEPGIRNDVIEIDDSGAEYSVDATPPVLPSACPG
jgi:hypothetical protein